MDNTADESEAKPQVRGTTGTSSLSGKQKRYSAAVFGAACGLLLFFLLLSGGTNQSSWFIWTIVLSVITAATQLSAAWAGLGTDSFIRRTLLAFRFAAIVAAGGLSGLCGIMLGENVGGDEIAKATTTIGLFGLSAWVISQLPFFLLRYFFGWHFVDSDSTSKTSSETSLSIGDLMFLTAMIALSLGSLRLSAMMQSQSSFQQHLLILAIVGCVVLVTFLAIVLPAMVFLLADQKDAGRARAICTVILMIAAGAVLVSAPTNPDLFMALSAYLTGVAIFVAVPLMMLSEAGISLKLHSRKFN
ncbi:MAG: hypothetical protein AAF497_14710 [Planctomycetota bacterium]